MQTDADDIVARCELWLENNVTIPVQRDPAGGAKPAEQFWQRPPVVFMPAADMAELPGELAVILRDEEGWNVRCTASPRWASRSVVGWEIEVEGPG